MINAGHIQNRCARILLVNVSGGIEVKGTFNAIQLREDLQLLKSATGSILILDQYLPGMTYFHFSISSLICICILNSSPINFRMQLHLRTLT